MSRATLRSVILILGLITALIHLVLLNIGIYRFRGSIDVLFTLNGLGYLALLVALLRPPEFLAGRETLVHYAFIAFTAVTILAWLVINPDFTNPVGVITKVDELLLIVALWLHMRAEKEAAVHA